MKISKRSRQTATQLFRHCLADGALEAGRARSVVAALLEQKPRDYLPIASHFARLLQLHIDRRTVRIESTVPLDAPLLDPLKNSLTRRYGSGLDFQTSLNPGLIGGLRIQVGSDVYDSSIRARLQHLVEAL